MSPLSRDYTSYSGVSIVLIFGIFLLAELAAAASAFPAASAVDHLTESTARACSAAPDDSSPRAGRDHTCGLQYGG